MERAELAEAAIVLRRLLDAVEAGRVEVDSGVGLGRREVALLRSVADRMMQRVREHASAAAGEMSSQAEPDQAEERINDLEVDGDAFFWPETDRADELADADLQFDGDELWAKATLRAGLRARDLE